MRKPPVADRTGYYFGTQYRGFVALEGRRRRLTFNGLTDRYAVLGAALLNNCAPAPRRTRAQRLRWLALALTSAATFALLILYITTHPDTERTITHDDYTEIVNVPGISDTGYAVIATGLATAVVTAIVSVVMFWRKD